MGKGTLKPLEQNHGRGEWCLFFEAYFYHLFEEIVDPHCAKDEYN